MVASVTAPLVVQALTVQLAAWPGSVLACERDTCTQRLGVFASNAVVVPVCVLVAVGMAVFGVDVGLGLGLRVGEGVGFGGRWVERTGADVVGEALADGAALTDCLAVPVGAELGVGLATDLCVGAGV